MIVSAVSRCVVTASVDSTKFQTVSISGIDGTTEDKIENLQPYGLTSRPVTGSECVRFTVGGCSDHSVAMAVADRTFRVKNLAEGEVCLYSKFGQKIYLKSDGNVEVTVESGKNISLGGGAMQKLIDDRFVSLFNSHVHGVTIVTLNTPTPTLTPTVPLVGASCSTVTTKAS